MQALAKLNPSSSPSSSSTSPRTSPTTGSTTRRAQSSHASTRMPSGTSGTEAERLDWSIDVDPEKGLVPDAAIGIYGTPIWDSARRPPGRATAPRIPHLAAVPVPPRRAGSVAGHRTDRGLGAVVRGQAVRRHPGDGRGPPRRGLPPLRPRQARDTSTRSISELKKLLDQILTDSRWDMKFLGMQIIVEGLALAAFGTLRDTTNNAAAARPHHLRDGGRGAPRRLRRALAARVLPGLFREPSATSARISSTRPAC